MQRVSRRERRQRTARTKAFMDAVQTADESVIEQFPFHESWWKVADTTAIGDMIVAKVEAYNATLAQIPEEPRVVILSRPEGSE